MWTGGNGLECACDEGLERERVWTGGNGLECACDEGLERERVCVCGHEAMRC